MTHLEEHSSIITFVDPLPRPDLGSLLRSFSSPYFTLDMLVNYLFTKKDIQGVHDFLVNKLYSYRDFEVEFYIPQISYMVVKYHSPSLEKFLVDKCSGNITLFLKIYWCVLAYGQAERKKKLRYEYVESLLKRCELSMINGNLSRVVSLDRSTISSTSDKADRTEMMKMDYHRKKMKADYLTATYKFINILTSVSLKLKTLKGEERKPQLKLYVKRVNRWMQQLRKKHIADKDEYFRKLFYGVHIPFSADKEDNSTMIVNILEDEVTCFNTKMRAPYRIVVETVDMEEIGSMEANVKFRGHHSHTASRSSRQLGDKSISSDLDTSVGEEDAFQDLLEEQQKHKEKEKNAVKVTEQQTNDKYKGLAEFENFLQEEEFKAQDGNIEQSDDMMQRFEFLQKGTNSEEYPNLISPAKKGFDDFPDFMDGGRKSSLMTHQAPLTQARRSLMADKPPGYPRSMSPDHQTAEGNVKYLESFLPNQKIPEGVRAKGEEILDGLREQAAEEAAGEGEAKTVDAYPLDKEPEIIGWGPWDELWEYKKNLIRQKSIFGHYQSYKLRCLIVKANDDLRQELIAMQIMKKFTAIWKEAGLSLRVRTYDILVTSEDSGIIEFVSDSYSIDGLKKKYPGKSLLTFFKETYGFDFEEAQKNFIDSLAAYCLICYFLQIKDRHNGNILLDAYGHIVHIDFGFILCTSPGGINFESAPFKLTREYGEMMGGPNSNTYTYFKLQLTKGFMELRKHVEELAYLIQIMVDGSDLACFEKFDLQEFKERFKERSTDEEAVEHVSRLCDMSYDNWRTVQYDNFQKYTNGVLP